MSLAVFEQKFLENKLNFTSQRRAIAKVVIESEDHPDIDEIFFRVKKIDKTASLATVYRTVNLFTELGLTSKRDFKEKYCSKK
jgi:Fur family ferric uptake transcriptional regulator